LRHALTSGAAALPNNIRACHSSPSMQPLCHAEECNALLQFKESLVIHRSASSEPLAW